jgi:spore germination cell wall hydrolase CwlJ-like protein
MNDLDALTLCAFKEAALEPDDGVAAVARVVMNRTTLKYQSDGTIQGTIFRNDQFSWTQFDFVQGHYTKVALTPQAQAARVAGLLVQSQAYKVPWARVEGIVSQVMVGMYRGAEYAQITDDTLLYVNLAISNPAWATPEKLVCVIGHHHFFHP